MRPTVRRLLVVSVPACAAAAIIAVAAVELWVRLTWDPLRGTPGFYVSDPVRGQRLAAGYAGWFAGVPVRINRLGFRDDRDYDVKKGPNTLRILVVGDSVTFGHGAVFETTYPYLLEQELRSWRPDVDWQVWNLGVPGYNTSQELAYITEVTPAYAADLVIVGFFPNDVVGNAPLPAPGRIRIWRSRAASWVRRQLWSAELYRRVYLTAMWRLRTSGSTPQPAAVLAADDDRFAGSAASAAEQRLTPFNRMSDAEVAAVQCPSGSRSGPAGAQQMQREPGWPAFVDAVGALQDLRRRQGVRLMFFINIAPPVCPDGDFFYDGGIRYVNQLFVDVLGQGTPVVSPLESFFPLRPSQVPQASGHSLGNANLVKAQVLFSFLRDHVLPATTAPLSHAAAR